MQATIAVFGPTLGWVEILERRLRELDYQVIGADGSGSTRDLTSVIIAGTFEWRGARHAREAWEECVRGLWLEAEKLEELMSQDSDVIFLIHLVSVPAARRNAVLRGFETFAQDVEAATTNLDGLDASVIVLAFDDWSEVEDDIGRVAGQLTEGFGSLSDIALHIDEVSDGNLKEALIASSL